MNTDKKIEEDVREELKCELLLNASVIVDSIKVKVKDGTVALEGARRIGTIRNAQRGVV